MWSGFSDEPLTGFVFFISISVQTEEGSVRQLPPVNIKLKQFYARVFTFLHHRFRPYGRLNLAYVSFAQEEHTYWVVVFAIYFFEITRS